MNTIAKYLLAAIILCLSLGGCGCSDYPEANRKLAYEIGWTCRDKGISLEQCEANYRRLLGEYK